MSVRFRLSVMMFLQYAIWGAWLPILWPFLAGARDFTASQIGNIFAVGALGAIAAPFVVGQIADRHVATEKILAVSHLLGAILVWILATVDSYSGFLAFSLLYSLIYAPTLPLTNSIAFHHLADRDTEFGKVRVWGTVGWVVVGIAVGHWLLSQHTPASDIATAAFVEERVLNEEQRLRLRSESEITLEDGSVLTGTSRQEGDEIVVMTEGSERRLAEQEVALVRPLSETFAADGKAEEFQTFLTTVDSTDDSQALASDLIARGLLAETALQGPIQQAQNRGRADAFRLSAILGVLLALFCLVLPHTPPQKGEQSSATREALREIKKSPLLILFLLAVPVSCIHQFYFVHTAGFLSGFEFETGWIDAVFGVGGGGLMTVGQVSEILVLAVIPLVAKKVSRKVFLGLGLLAYALRMAGFAYVEQLAELGIPPALTLIASLALHGLCFGCFIFVSFMIVDEETTGDVRASAQSLYNLVIIGIGIIVGSKLAGIVQEWATPDSAVNYSKLFAVPLWASLVCLVLLSVFYPAKRQTRSSTP